MAKDASLFSSSNVSTKNNIYVDDGFALDIIGHGDINCQHGQIVDVYHVPNLSVYLLFISQVTKACKIVKFWLDRFFVKDLKKDGLIITEGVLKSKD